MRAKQVLCFLLLLACGASSVENDTAPDAAAGYDIVSEVYIGIRTAELQPEEKAQIAKLGSKIQRGLRIKSIEPGSPAEQAGLKTGDIIISISGAMIQSPHSIIRALKNARVGVPVHIVRLNGEGTESVPVIVAARPQPVVVGTLTSRAPQQAIDEAVNPLMDKVAELLASETPSLPEIRACLQKIWDLEGNPKHPNQIRLYYETATGHITVTLQHFSVIIHVCEHGSATEYCIEKVGDALPEQVRRQLMQLH